MCVSRSMSAEGHGKPAITNANLSTVGLCDRRDRLLGRADVRAVDSRICLFICMSAQCARVSRDTGKHSPCMHHNVDLQATA